MCGNFHEAQHWVDQLSPLFDPDLMDKSAIRVMLFDSGHVCKFEPTLCEAASKPTGSSLPALLSGTLDARYALVTSRVPDVSHK